MRTLDFCGILSTIHNSNHEREKNQTNPDWGHSIGYLVNIPQDHQGHKKQGKKDWEIVTD